ncbi:GntR family transcriptional regulator [Rhizobium sp. ARZ01]|uniref:GntR family transcriptional regulator n=1 Tax=Rhizobium sp. ARZ01 TaxID=2769313 RepID=UPI00177FACAF|nr:GntR family transcriptional regulator [Rhizobium sp. ARZ01]MBD9375097.1 GntR family transcriptional regulator [Rhizobium sp. ARZ01]
MLVTEGRQPCESVKHWVHRTLRHALMTGRFQAGEPVTINGLAEMLEVSAMPVREALQYLVADGALELLDNRRVRVPEMVPEKFDEILAARIALETVAAERALPQLDFIRIARLQHLDSVVDDAYDAGDIERGIAANFDFHRCIYEVRSNGVLLPMIESLWLRLGPFMRHAAENHWASYQVDRHAEALEAIRCKNADALKAAITADIQDGIGHLGRAQFLDTAARTFATRR